MSHLFLAIKTDCLLHPWSRNPLCILIESPDCSDEFLEGHGEVLVDNGQVEPVAVQEVDLFAGANHGMKLIILGKVKEIWTQFHQHSTYSFYARRSQKRKKILMTWLYFLCFWDLWGMSVKAVHKMLIKLTPGVNFINVLYTGRSRKCKKDSLIVNLFCAFGICACKSCS